LTRTFGTLREAKVEYARITNRRYEGTFVEPNKITVNEWLDQWLDRKAEDLEESTVYSYTMTLGRVRGKLGHIRLQELTEDHVEAWMRWGLREGRVRGGKAGAGLGVTSVEMSLARLKEALNRAVARHLVAVNVAQEVTIPRNVRKAERRAEAVVQPWNVEEVHAFVRAVKDDRLYAPFLLSLMGLRPAEICGMRWADVEVMDEHGLRRVRLYDARASCFTYLPLGVCRRPGVRPWSDSTEACPGQRFRKSACRPWMSCRPAVRNELL
jgi:integrase